MTGRCWNLKPWWTFQVWFISFLGETCFSRFYGSMIGFGAICICRIAAPRRLFQTKTSGCAGKETKKSWRNKLPNKSRDTRSITVELVILENNCQVPGCCTWDPLRMMGSCFHLAFLNRAALDTARLTNYAKLPPNKVKQLGYRKYLSSVQRCPCTWSWM